MQNYTFGGKKNIKGSALENLVKKEIEMRQQLQIEEMESGSFYTEVKGQERPERVGTAAFNKRLSSQQHSPRELHKVQSMLTGNQGAGQSRENWNL